MREGFWAAECLGQAADLFLDPSSATTLACGRARDSPVALKSIDGPCWYKSTSKTCMRRYTPIERTEEGRHEVVRGQQRRDSMAWSCLARGAAIVARRS